MCLYPKIIRNRKYLPNKKNKGQPPIPDDPRKKWIAAGCGNCIECRKQKSNEWRIRLLEEIQTDRNAKYVTLTFSNEKLAELIERYGIKESNAIAAKAVRLFLECWRKINKKSVKHWLITELGHEGTERIHLHGILFTERDEMHIADRWQFGNVRIGTFCNEKTINYIIKYVTKIDNDHKSYKSQIFASKELGLGYLKKHDAREKRDYYKLNNGQKVGLPIYLRNKIFTETERENMWMQLLDKGETYVCGEKVLIKDSNREYLQLLTYHQKRNKRIGYGDDSDEWKKEDYNLSLKMLKDMENKKIYEISERELLEKSNIDVNLSNSQL